MSQPSKVAIACILKFLALNCEIQTETAVAQLILFNSRKICDWLCENQTYRPLQQIKTNYQISHSKQASLKWFAFAGCFSVAQW